MQINTMKTNINFFAVQVNKRYSHVSAFHPDAMITDCVVRVTQFNLLFWSSKVKHSKLGCWIHNHLTDTYLHQEMDFNFARYSPLLRDFF